uniref:Elongation of very long chain fatty acids protein n=1 Tax=Steinernema glaseri TaxID=37863 RepID=A0A1I7ZXH7_9BILA
MELSMPGWLLEMLIHPYDYDKAIAIMWDFLTYSLVVSLLYFVVIFLVKRVMHDQEPFCPEWPLYLCYFCTFVGLLIGFFSYIASFFTEDAAPDVLLPITEPIGFWRLLFTIAKLADFGNTLSIVLRNKPIIVLHWFQHIVALKFSLFNYGGKDSFTDCLVFMNSHARFAIYRYFSFSLLDERPPRFVLWWIASVQLIVFGRSLLNFEHLQFVKYPLGHLVIVLIILEVTYLVEFAMFFYQCNLENAKNQKNAIQKKEE